MGLLGDESVKAANTANIRLFYDISCRLRRTKVNATMPVEETSGQLLTDLAGQLKFWFEHLGWVFRALVTSPTSRSTPKFHLCRRNSNPLYKIEQGPASSWPYVNLDAQSWLRSIFTTVASVILQHIVSTPELIFSTSATSMTCLVLLCIIMNL